MTECTDVGNHPGNHIAEFRRLGESYGDSLSS